jgi:hypothetical protein
MQSGPATVESPAGSPKLKLVSSETLSRRSPCHFTQMRYNLGPHRNQFVSVHGIITKNWEETKVPSLGEQMDKFWYSHKIAYYSGIKRNDKSWKGVEEPYTECVILTQPFGEGRTVETVRWGVPRSWGWSSDWAECKETVTPCDTTVCPSLQNVHLEWTLMFTLALGWRQLVGIGSFTATQVPGTQDFSNSGDCGGVCHMGTLCAICSITCKPKIS